MSAIAFPGRSIGGGDDAMAGDRSSSEDRALEAHGTEDRALEAHGTEDRLLEANGTWPRFLRDMDRDEVSKRMGHNLPHWTAEGAVYHVRFRLYDSIPGNLRKQLLDEKEGLLAVVKGKDRGLTTHEKRRLLRLYSDRVDRLLDAGYGSCWLARRPIAHLVAGAVRFFEGERYGLYAWCIMPNHVHAVVRPFPEIALPDVLHSWKSFTANKANELLGRTGKFWQREHFDRLIRDDDELLTTAEYVYFNPEKAGLRDWEWRFRSPEAIGVQSDLSS
jgi:REP element-mobilizing transposase RayT